MEYRELRSALTSKGLAATDRQRNHVYFYVTIGGKKERATMMSHGARGQIDSTLLGTMARQMRLNTTELRRFVACTVSRERWIELWVENRYSPG